MLALVEGLTALAAHSRPLGFRALRALGYLVRDPHRATLAAKDHDVRDGDRAFTLSDAALDLLLGIRLGVALDHADVLDQNAAAFVVDVDHTARFALIAA